MPGMRCVDQHEWQRPLRGDWLIRLEEAVLDAAHVVLVAHNLGCIQLAAWAAHSQQTHRVRAALLVAPLDVEAPAVRERLPSWSPIERQRLPFKSWMIGPASQGDNAPAIAKKNVAWDTEWAQALATTWGAQWLEPWDAPQVSAKHISEQRSDWPLGQALLHELMKA
jgi:predicted alpha/beta hydrolase family esterase